MRLTVLGGSAAGGNPGQPCSGYLAESGETRIALDLGTATLQQLREHTDAALLDGIVISHMHLDHVLDLLAMRYFLAYSPGASGRRAPLWLPPGGLAFLDRLALALEDDGEGDPYFAVFDAREYDPARQLTAGVLTISFAPTVHYVPTWAMRVSDGVSSLTYTADTGPAANLEGFAAGTDLLIAEGSCDEPGDEPRETRGHLMPEEAGELAARSSAKALLLTHLWQQYGLERAARRAANRYAGPVFLAQPGLSIDLGGPGGPPHAVEPA
ncbi:MAG: MBL fold metallo-hydrolase [Chloroflexota bacterium]